MSWEKSNYTATGAALLSESLSGGALTITRAVSGTGSADTDLSEETTVSGDLHELMLLGMHAALDYASKVKHAQREVVSRCGIKSIVE